MVEVNTYEGAGAPRKLPEGVILGMGNPLLDLSAHVPAEFLGKYNIKTGTAILAEAEHEPMYQDMVDSFPCEYVAGGATQNSIRVAQWMSQSPGATGFLGAIGKDKFGEQLEQACKSAGVASHYYKTAEKPTGVCAVTILDKERSLTTKLDAANEYKHSHTLSAEVQSVINKAEIFYIASFFLTVPEGPESVMNIAKHACDNNKILAMNLSAEFLINFFSEPMTKAIPYMDFVFGNETEAAAFGKKREWEGASIPEIALKLSALPKENGSRPRVVVFSQGSDPTVVACNGEVTLYPVPALKGDLLVDTNGAGDAFVGGFLARLAAGFPVEESVRAGHYAARVVIQRSGCTTPEQPDI